VATTAPRRTTTVVVRRRPKRHKAPAAHRRPAKNALTPRPVPGSPPRFASPPAQLARAAGSRSDAALFAAALGLCLLALAGAGVVSLVRREAGLA
jgi:hypothetical protein